MIVPYNTLVYYPDETDDEFYEEKIFSEIRSVLAIDIDIIDWHNRCEQIGFGRKNLQKIELFYSNDERSYILLDNYKDPYDQLSLISLGRENNLGVRN